MEHLEKQLENNFAEHKIIMDKIDDIIKSIAEIQCSMAGLPEKIFEKADERYASKTSERVIYGMVGTIVTAVLLSLIYLVILK